MPDDLNPGKLRLAIVSCCEGDLPSSLFNFFRQVSEANPDVVVSLHVLSETRQPTDAPPGVCKEYVDRGTKLRKLVGFVGRTSADYVCVCDPDVELAPDAACRVVERALVHGHQGVVVSFGRIGARVSRGVVAGLVSCDKLLSHCLLRPTLWRLAMGISLPGQFLVFSPGILLAHRGSVDTYLDDLLIGLLCRKMGATVECSSETVGNEEPRSGWCGLLMQRLRWMKGFLALVGYFRCDPKALVFLGIHYAAYHGLPIFLMVIAAVGLFLSPWAVVLLASTVVGTLSLITRKSPITWSLYLIAFPVLHAVASIGAWIPLPQAMLRRR
jgi:hypothetical protein